MGKKIRIFMGWKSGASLVETDKKFIKNTESYGSPEIYVDMLSSPTSVTFVWDANGTQEKMKTTDRKITKLFEEGLPIVMEIREGNMDDRFNPNDYLEKDDEGADPVEDERISTRKISKRKANVVVSDDELEEEDNDVLSESIELTPDYINDIFITNDSGMYVAKRQYEALFSFTSLELMLEKLNQWMKANSIDVPIWEDDGSDYYLLEYDDEND